MTNKEQIEAYLSQILEDETLAGCFLLDVHLEGGQKLEVTVDSDTGISFEECQKISRMLEARLDEDLILGEKYTLEVSSPGVERPLQLLRQFPKHIGRTIIAEMRDGSKVEGVLKSIQGNMLELEQKKKKETLMHTVDFEQMEKAFVQISFKAK